LGTKGIMEGSVIKSIAVIKRLSKSDMHNVIWSNEISRDPLPDQDACFYGAKSENGYVYVSGNWASGGSSSGWIFKFDKNTGDIITYVDDVYSGYYNLILDGIIIDIVGTAGGYGFIHRRLQSNLSLVKEQLYTNFYLLSDISLNDGKYYNSGMSGYNIGAPLHSMLNKIYQGSLAEVWETRHVWEDSISFSWYWGIVNDGSDSYTLGYICYSGYPYYQAILGRYDNYGNEIWAFKHEELNSQGFLAIVDLESFIYPAIYIDGIGGRLEKRNKSNGNLITSLKLNP